MFRQTHRTVEAVKGVSFEIAPGELFGLLGPNGAGKTTTIKMLITLLLPTSGSASVLGRDVVQDVREVRRRIGYVFGIDPVGARELRATVAGLREQGKTVLLTTHYMFEADELCDRIAVIREGEIVAEGTPADLKGLVSAGRVLEVETYGVAEGEVAAVRGVPGVRSAVVEERGQAQVLVVSVEPGAEVTQQVLARLGDTRVGRVSHREPTLEDAYVELVTGADA